MPDKPPEYMTDRKHEHTRWHRQARWVAVTTVSLVALLVIGQSWISYKVGEEIRTNIEQYFTQTFEHLDVEVDSATRADGYGIIVNGLRLFAREDHPQATTDNTANSDVQQLSIHIQRLDLVGNVDLHTLLQSTPEFQQIKIRGGKIDFQGDGTDFSFIQKVLTPTPTETAEVRMPELTVSDLVVSVKTGQHSTPAVLYPIEGRVIHRVKPATDGGIPQPQIQFAFNCSGEQVKHLELTGRLLLDEQQWHVTGLAEKAVLDKAMVSMLPAQWEMQLRSQFTDALDYRCELDIAAKVTGARSYPPKLTMVANVNRGYVRHNMLPYPLTDLRASIRLDGGLAQIEVNDGRFGGATLSGQWASTDPNDLTRGALDLVADNLRIDEHLISGMPNDLAKQLRKYNPEGNTRLELEYNTINAAPEYELTAHLLDVSVKLSAFPYPLAHGQGIVKVRHDSVEVNRFRAKSHGRTFTINANVKHPVLKPTGWVEFSSDGPIPIDAQLLNALKSRTREFVSKLQPNGMLQLQSARYEYHGSKQDMKRFIALELQQASIVYEKFPYPLHRVHGKLICEDHVWSLRDMTGYNGRAFIQCNGTFTELPDGDGQIALQLAATDLAVDDALRHAMVASSQSNRHLFDSFNIEGSLDHLKLDVSSRVNSGKKSLVIHASKWVPGRSVTSNEIKMKPSWFPYDLNQVTGEFIYRDGTIQMLDVNARHKNTRFAFDGHARLLPNGSWSTRIDTLNIDKLELDAPLLSALPAPLSDGLRQLDVDGQVMLSGELELSQAAGVDQQVVVGWDLSLDTTNASINGGSRIEHLFGGVRIAGRHDSSGTHCFGQIQVDSMMLLGEQIRDVRGPFALENNRLLVGKWSQRFLPTQQPASSLFGRSLGGVVSLDAQVDLEDEAKFILQLNLANGDLAYIARRQGVNSKTAGRTFASLQLHGVAGKRSTWQGDGQIDLQKADLYQLPLLMSVFNIVSLNDSDVRSFNSSHIDFFVRDETIRMNRIIFRGGNVALYGQGRMKFDSSIDLDFYAAVGQGRSNFEIPLLRNVLTEASRNLLKIEVVGSLEKPRVESTPLPELDETMERFFRDLNQRIARPPNPGGMPAIRLR